MKCARADSARGGSQFEVFGVLWCEPHWHVSPFNVPTSNPTPSCRRLLQLLLESNTKGNQLKDHTCLCLSVHVCVCHGKTWCLPTGDLSLGYYWMDEGFCNRRFLLNPSMRLEQKHEKVAQLLQMAFTSHLNLCEPLAPFSLCWFSASLRIDRWWQGTGAVEKLSFSFSAWTPKIEGACQDGSQLCNDMPQRQTGT